MTENILTISPIDARLAALKEADITSARFTEIHLDGSLYELKYETEEMRYTAYVDAESAEVLGFDCEPVVVNDFRYELRAA